MDRPDIDTMHQRASDWSIDRRYIRNDMEELFDYIEQLEDALLTWWASPDDPPALAAHLARTRALPDGNTE